MTGSTGAPRARVLITGDELLRGFIQDANSGHLAERLRELGVELDEIRIVGDEHGAIERVLDASIRRDRVDLVVVSGGLGPTHDDRTTEAVADAVGVELELREDALAVVEARVRAYGRMRSAEEVAAFTPGNRKQATLPAGARWVDPLGTAPGYVVPVDSDRAVVVLPGPPSELRHAWSGIEATPELAAVLARVPARHERLVRMWGVPESTAAQQLAVLGHVDDDARRVTICARDGELELSVRGQDPRRIDELVAGLGDAFGDRVFALDDHRPVEAIVADQLVSRRWRLATAESCTGGMLGATLTELAGSSAWYLGGLVTYANEAKFELAGVAPEDLRTHGAVSEPVARQLAAGARSALGAEVGIGITGIAGPGGGSDDKPVGTVHVAIDTPAGVEHLQVRIPGNRATVRRRSCAIALHALRRVLVVSDG
jgi:nicotinamide-nucleotide amidase